MNLTYAEFFNTYWGARSIDDHIYPRLSISEWMLKSYAFDNTGCRYIRNVGEPYQPAREVRG